mmetsp:Transcript_16429/g.34853  ORF Transcript_16429/g.34853 Transcript_16429/m.34853 type:complete len:257 (-) Transcript_16429:1878-2648(-)
MAKPALTIQWTCWPRSAAARMYEKEAPTRQQLCSSPTVTTQPRRKTLGKPSCLRLCHGSSRSMSITKGDSSSNASERARWQLLSGRESAEASLMAPTNSPASLTRTASHLMPSSSNGAGCDSLARWWRLPFGAFIGTGKAPISRSGSDPLEDEEAELCVREHCVVACGPSPKRLKRSSSVLMDCVVPVLPTAALPAFLSSGGGDGGGDDGGWVPTSRVPDAVRPETVPVKMVDPPMLKRRSPPCQPSPYESSMFTV